MSYDIFSKYYDSLISNVDYKKRTELLLNLFNKYDKTPSLLLDLGSGTGGFSMEFAGKGIEVIGVEPSYGMLSVAKEKAFKSGLDILYLCQSGQTLDLYGTVDGAVCCLDTINHIICKRELQKTFNNIALFLEKDRLFIFDANTLYKQEHILGDNTFVYENEEVYCVWQNCYNKKTKITDICLDFFSEDNGTYNRDTEEFSERVYSREELVYMLNKAGFSLVACLDEEGSKPKEKSQRLIYVVRRK